MAQKSEEEKLFKLQLAMMKWAEKHKSPTNKSYSEFRIPNRPDKSIARNALGNYAQIEWKEDYKSVESLKSSYGTDIFKLTNEQKIHMNKLFRFYKEK